MARIVLHCSYDPPHRAFVDELHPCFVARGIGWVRSFLTLDATRSICEFEAPYAEMVRDACRQANILYDAVWRAEVWHDQDAIQEPLSPILAEVDYATPLTPERWAALKEVARPCFQEREIQKLTSLVASDRRRSLCIFDAVSAEAVRQAYRQAGIPFIRIWRSRLILPQPAYPANPR